MDGLCAINRYPSCQGDPATLAFLLQPYGGRGAYPLQNVHYCVENRDLCQLINAAPGAITCAMCLECDGHRTNLAKRGGFPRLWLILLSIAPT